MALHRTVTFSRKERARIAHECMALGIHFEELVHDATMQAVDELEGVARSAPWWAKLIMKEII